MTRKITIVTGNPGKLASFRRYLEPLGFEITHEDLGMVEPQMDSIEDVARAKARQAYDILKTPLIVEDTGFYIEAWNGWPGPYNKFNIDTLGVDGYLALMKGKTDRRCKFFSALVYIDDKGQEHLFTSEHKGTLAAIPDDLPLRADAKSALWKIFVPVGSDKTLNEIDGQERKDLFATWANNSVAVLFARWLEEKTKPEQPKAQPKRGPAP